MDLPEVALAFQRAYPRVRVSIMPAPSAQAMEALRAHRADFGVVGGFAAAPEIEAEPLVEEDIVVVGSPKYAGRRLSRREAEVATWIVQPEGSAFQAGWRWLAAMAWPVSAGSPSRRSSAGVRPRDGVLTPSAREFVAMLRARWSRAPARRRAPRR